MENMRTKHEKQHFTVKLYSISFKWLMRRFSLENHVTMYGILASTLDKTQIANVHSPFGS